MNANIMITCELACRPGKTVAADLACSAVVRAANGLDGLSAQWQWAEPDARINIHYQAETSEAVENHLRDHGAMYAGLDGLCSVIRFEVAGPAGDVPLAAFRQLTATVDVL